MATYRRVITVPCWAVAQVSALVGTVLLMGVMLNRQRALPRRPGSSKRRAYSTDCRNHVDLLVSFFSRPFRCFRCRTARSGHRGATPGRMPHLRRAGCGGMQSCQPMRIGALVTRGGRVVGKEVPRTWPQPRSARAAAGPPNAAPAPHAKCSCQSASYTSALRNGTATPVYPNALW